MSDKLPPKILVVEHDEILNANLCNMIERYWFDVSRVKSSDEALRVVKVNPPNIAIISSRIQDMSAIEMGVQLRKIKNLQELPIIFLIDKAETIENYKLIDNNYIDLINRPFTPNELMTTIRAMLKRSKPVFQDKIIKYKNIQIDLSTFKVFIGTNQIHLGPTEFKILQLLAQTPKTIYSRRQIMDYVWGADKDIAHRTIDVHINRIRTLMKANWPKDGEIGDQLIKTIRSGGYCLD